MTSHLVLIGHMGVGKTTVGRGVAEACGRTFVDLDEVIAARESCTIRELFAQHGEAGFRTRETAALHATLDASAQVIAVGGGAILAPENRTALRGQYVVRLVADPYTVWLRIGESVARRERPPLPSAALREDYLALCAAREAAYAEYRRRVRTDADSLSVIVQHLVKEWADDLAAHAADGT